MENNPELVTNGFPERFKQFLESFGFENPNKLASTMLADEDQSGIKPLAIKYRRWLNGDASPSYDGLVDLAVRFDLDMNWLMMGIGQMKREYDASIPSLTPIDPGTNLGDGAIWKQRYFDLEVKYNSLKDDFQQMLIKHNALQTRFNDFMEKMVKKLDPSFNESGSLPTAKEITWAFNVAGFTQEKNKGETPIIPLNSLDNVRPMYTRIFA